MPYPAIWATMRAKEERAVLELILNNMSVVWLALMVLLLIIEALTAPLVCIWFALGALAALITALCGGPVWLQIIWFLAVSLLTLWLTRPVALKYLNNRSVATNADRVIGEEAVAVEEIDNIAGTGAVKCDGREWTARSASGEKIAAGAVVRVERIEGVKLIVTRE